MGWAILVMSTIRNASPRQAIVDDPDDCLSPDGRSSIASVFALVWLLQKYSSIMIILMERNMNLSRLVDTYLAGSSCAKKQLVAAE